jgi:hypothetical protein
VEDDVWLRRNVLGTDAIPQGTSRLVFRHTDPAAALMEEYQIQNSVAIMNLARQSLQSKFSQRLVPLVFAWQDKTSDDLPGWAITEFLEGETIRYDLQAMSLTDRLTVLNQLAQVLKALQDYELPKSACCFGGLGFDEAGEYTGRPMTIPCGGPFDSYGEMCHGMLLWQADAHDRSKYLVENDELKIAERIKPLRKRVSTYPQSRLLRLTEIAGCLWSKIRRT